MCGSCGDPDLPHQTPGQHICGTIKLMRFFEEEERKLAAGEIIQCPWCRMRQPPLRVAGHVQCVNCHQVIEGCCEGDSLPRACEVSGSPSSASSASTA